MYLDNQATTRCDPRVLDAMLPWFGEEYGNPHSTDHAMGQRAEAAVERARAETAALIGADPKEVIFTSGATESTNLALKGAARHARLSGDPRRRIVTLSTEHKCTLACVADLAGEGFDPVLLPVRPDGLLDPDMLREALEHPTLLVSIMAVNNEIGVVQDIRALATIAKGAGALFHTDAAQAAGKIPVDVKAWGVDLLSLSGHKIYGPKGVGALFVRRRPRVRLAPLFSGGGQERGLRPGTFPSPLIVGFGTACRLARAEMKEEADRIAVLRSRLLARLREAIPGLRVNGSAEARISGNLSRDLPGHDRCRHHPTLSGSLCFDGRGLLLGRDRTLTRTEQSRLVGGGGFPELADRDRTLYLGRRNRLCGCRPWRRPRSVDRRSGGLNGTRRHMPKMTFLERDGTRREVEAPLGLSVLEIAHKHGVDIEGACEGSLACSTCHVIVDPAWFGKLADPTEDEEDMLDLAFGLEQTSRLGCQIVMTDKLDGLVVRLPAGSRNLLNE